MQNKDFYIKNGQLFGPLSHRGIPVTVLRDAIEWIAWSADGDGAFRSGEMREDMGIPRNQASTILGALSSIGAVSFVSRRMGYAVTDDDADGWIGSLTIEPPTDQNAAETPVIEPCGKPEPAYDAWDESGVSCYEPRVADLAAIMRVDSMGRDIAVRCWIGEARAYLFLRPEGNRMRLLGMAKQSELERAEKACFEGGYDGDALCFDDESKLRNSPSAKRHGLVIRGPYPPTMYSPDVKPPSAPRSAPRGSSTTVNVPLTASDRDMQRMANICKKLNIDMTMY